MPFLCRIKNVVSGRYVVTGDTYNGAIYHQDHNGRLNAIWARRLVGPNQYEFRDMKHGYQLVNGEGLRIPNVGGGISQPDVGHIWDYEDRAQWTMQALPNGNVTLCDGYQRKFLTARSDENDMHLRQQDAWSEWQIEEVDPANLMFPVTRWNLSVGSSIEYYVATANSGAIARDAVFAVIERAVNKWVEAFNRLVPNTMNLQARRVDSSDQANLFFKWDSLPSAPQDAAADVDNSGSSGNFRGIIGPRTVVFNKDQLWVPTGLGWSLHTAAVHELGHVFGIDHSSWPDTVMKPTLPVWSLNLHDPIDAYNTARLTVRYADVLFQ